MDRAEPVYLPSAAGSLGGASLYDYWIVLYRRRFVIGLVAGAAGLFAYLISVALPPLYEAKAVFYVPADTPPTSFTTTDAASQIAGRPMLPIPESKAASVNVGIIKSKGFVRRLQETMPRYGVDDLLKRIDVKISGEFLVEIYARDRDPKAAETIANRLVALYRDFHEDIARRRAESIEQTLAAQRAVVVERLQALHDELRRVQEESGILPQDLSATRMSDLLTESEKRKFVGESIRVGELQRRIASEQTLKERVDANLLEAALQRENPPQIVVEVEAAVSPQRPVFPVPALNAGIAAVLGLVVGCYYALLLGYLDRLKELRIARQLDWSPFLVTAEDMPVLERRRVDERTVGVS